MFRSKAEKKVLEAGYDPARLPPGQYLTEKWPVLHAGSIPSTDLTTWTFEVSGEVENPVTLSWDDETTSRWALVEALRKAGFHETQLA